MSPLTEHRSGQEFEIIRISSRDPYRLDRLATYGVVPGSRIRLQQKRPAFVIQIGETSLALDTDLARDIFVRAVDAPDQDTEDTLENEVALESEDGLEGEDGRERAAAG